MSEFYEFEDTQESIQALKVKCANPSFWQKISGTARCNREELAIQQLNYTTAKIRYDQHISAIENQYDKAMLDLKNRQEREWRQLNQSFQEPQINQQQLQHPPHMNMQRPINDRDFGM